MDFAKPLHGVDSSSIIIIALADLVNLKKNGGEQFTKISGEVGMEVPKSLLTRVGMIIIQGTSLLNF